MSEKKPPLNWSPALLGEYSLITTGRLDANAQNPQGEYPFFTCGDEVLRIDSYAFDTEAVLLAGNGNFGVKWYKGRFNAYQRTYVIQPVLVNGKYLYFQIQNSIREITLGNRGSTVRFIRIGDIQNCKVYLAPLEEQNRIVAEIEKQLSRLDAATAALKRVQANLKRYRASVLKAACEGRLVPTEAELACKEGRDYEPADKLLERILRERRVRWEADTLAKMIASGNPAKDDSWKRKYKEPFAPDLTELPSLPEGWCWTNLSQLKLFSLYGPRFSSDDYARDGVVVLRTTDISSSGKVNMLAAPRLQLKESDIQKYKLMPGDLVFTRTGATVGKLAIFDDDVEAIPGAYLIHYRLTFAGSVPWYIYRFFQTKTGQDALVRGTRGIGQPNLNAPTIEAIPIPMPPQPEQGRILEALEQLLGVGARQEEVVEAAQRKASQVGAAVLQSAFSGSLVQQDTSDEPASALLDRIHTERASAAAGKPSKQNKKEPACV
jgi:type I restriction enzyme, S subunit